MVNWSSVKTNVMSLSLILGCFGGSPARFSLACAQLAATADSDDFHRARQFNLSPVRFIARPSHLGLRSNRTPFAAPLRMIPLVLPPHPPSRSLSLEIPGLKRPHRQRSPTMALGLTSQLWSVNDLLHYPVPRALKLDWCCEATQGRTDSREDSCLFHLLRRLPSLKTDFHALWSARQPTPIYQRFPYRASDKTELTKNS
jgi:hypothetical protein